LALLFWLSLVPFAIRWMDETHFAPMPTAAYGVVLAFAAIAYTLLSRAIIVCNGPESMLARAVGSDLKGKASLLMYVLATPLAFVHPWIALALYVLVALIWFIPDRRIESMV
jgi:TMEM175 potassium channel family protein